MIDCHVSGSGGIIDAHIYW